MPRFTFGDNEPEEGDLIPDGIYLAEVYNVEEKRNKADTADVWWWRATITAGPYEGIQPFPMMTVLPPSKGSFTFRPTLKSLGLPYQGNVDLSPEDINSLTPIACGIEVIASKAPGHATKTSKVVSIISVAEAATTLGASEASKEEIPF